MGKRLDPSSLPDNRVDNSLKVISPTRFDLLATADESIDEGSDQTCALEMEDRARRGRNSH